jgi:hypothetical protein
MRLWQLAQCLVIAVAITTCAPALRPAVTGVSSPAPPPGTNPSVAQMPFTTSGRYDYVYRLTGEISQFAAPGLPTISPVRTRHQGYTLSSAGTLELIRRDDEISLELRSDSGTFSIRGPTAIQIDSISGNHVRLNAKLQHNRILHSAVGLDSTACANQQPQEQQSFITSGLLSELVVQIPPDYQQRMAWEDTITSATCRAGIVIFATTLRAFKVETLTLLGATISATIRSNYKGAGIQKGTPVVVVGDGTGDMTIVITIIDRPLLQIQSKLTTKIAFQATTRAIETFIQETNSNASVISR